MDKHLIKVLQRAEYVFSDKWGNVIVLNNEERTKLLDLIKSTNNIERISASKASMPFQLNINRFDYYYRINDFIIAF